MAGHEQLEWERRAGRFAAGAALGYALLTLGGQVYTSASLPTRPENEIELLQVIASHDHVWLAGAVLQGVALLMFAIVLYYLYRVVEHRRPDVPAAALALAFVGPLLLAVSGVLQMLDRIDSAREFVATGERSEERATDLLQQQADLTLGLAGGGALAFALSLVFICMSAMRSGILSRFMGVLGIVVGSLYVLGWLLPIAGPGFIQLFWVGALAALFLDRWPGGRGPAWETGEPIPWPSSAQRRLDAASAAGPERGPEPGEPESPVPPATGEISAEGPVSKKRKRKRRR